ncbi:MAG: hypothetical protein ACOYUZ_02090 [Patescibacteria group bacterium]
MKHYTAILIPLFFVHCARSNIDLPPPKQARINQSEAEPNLVHWIDVSNGDDFWHTLKRSDKNVALIGTEVCPPCQTVKEWWESKVVPPGWQFVYWQLNGSDDLLTRSIKRIFVDLQKKDNLTVPYLSIIEDAADPPGKKSITATFRAVDGCTHEANDFLIMHPQGTINF